MSTTPTNAAHRAAEPFNGPFAVLSVSSVDRAVLSYRVIDAERLTIADRLSQKEAQWLCDCLNHTTPAAIPEGSREAGDDGWVLVPREPTPEMSVAGYYAVSKYVALEAKGFTAAEDIYRAMLAAAAPTPPLSANPASPEGRVELQRISDIVSGVFKRGVRQSSPDSLANSFNAIGDIAREGLDRLSNQKTGE